MVRAIIALLLVMIICWTACVIFPRDPTLDDTSGFDVDLASWPPSSQELVNSVGANGLDPNTPQGKANRLKFAEIFKKRYRTHDPKMAIGLRFEPSGKVELMTPARMEPWNMDRLAIQTWHETMAAFGHPFDIDLYLTYIGSPPLKIGELRAMPGRPGKVSIMHLPHPVIYSLPSVREVPAVPHVNRIEAVR